MDEISHLRPIVEADFHRHYASRGGTEAQLWGGFVRYVWNGGQWFATGKVLVIHKELAPGAVEFHCLNSGTGRDLTSAVDLFLQSLREVADTAVTFYDNPRISALAGFCSFPAVVSRVDKGVDATYQLMFFLKGR